MGHPYLLHYPNPNHASQGLSAGILGCVIGTGKLSRKKGWVVENKELSDYRISLQSFWRRASGKFY